MALHLPRIFALLHSYNGHIPGIFLDVHVIFLIQAQCATAQMGPQLQIILFGLLHEDYAACRLLLADARIVRSSRVFGFRPEDKRRLRGPLFTPRRDAPVDRSSRVFLFRPEDKRRRESSMFTPVGFNVFTALSSRTFSDRTEGGVPNSSPSERGAASTPWTRSASRSATLRAGRRDSSWRSTVRVSL